MVIVAFVFISMFLDDHADFFAFAQKYKTLGYEWQYTGRRACEKLEPCLPVTDAETGERITYYMLAKPE